MKLGLSVGQWNAAPSDAVDLVKRAEEFGYDSAWTAETYGTDAITPLAFLAAHTRRIKLGTAIAQLDARTPANLAMCCQTIEVLGGEGRMMLGIGASGPQIVEGWYGRPWGRPNARIRDAMTIIKKIFRREGPVTHDGEEISLPYDGEGSSGLGKPLKSILRASPNIPILVGAGTPANVRLTGEIADGWLGFHFTPSIAAPFKAWLAEGMAKRTDGKSADDFLMQASVAVRIADDVRAALQGPKANIALYVGGMGARGKNYHKDAMVKHGYAEAAERIQALFLAGRRDEAVAAVPDEYVDETILTGPAARIRERIGPWRDSGLTTLNVRVKGMDELKLMADLVNS
jgi:F420-dependent oxidoreductase-like protein